MIGCSKKVFEEEKFLLTLLSDLEIISKDVTDFKVENSVDEGDISCISSVYDLKVSMVDKDLSTYATVEMQNNKRSYDIMDRFTLYLAKSIVRANPKGTKYKKINSYVVAFLNFTLYEDEKYIRTFTINDKDVVELDNYKIILIELTKAKLCGKNNVRDWLEIFNAKDVENFKEKGDIMKDLAEKLEQLNKDRIFQAELDSLEMKEKDIITEKYYAREAGLAEGRAEGRVEGRAEGIIEGEIQATIAMAKKMKENGLDISLIIDITKLSKEEIEKL